MDSVNIFTEKHEMKNWSYWTFSNEAQTIINTLRDSEFTFNTQISSPGANIEQSDENKSVPINTEDAENYTQCRDMKNDEIPEIVSHILKNLNNGNQREVQNAFSDIKMRDTELILNELCAKVNNNRIRCLLCSSVIASENVNISAITKYLLLPWSEICCDNASEFIDSLSELVDKYQSEATEQIILPLILHPSSILVQDQQILINIISHLPANSWELLLRKYISHLKNPVESWQLSILLTLLENGKEMMNDQQILENIIELCSSCVLQYANNVIFGNLLISVITHSNTTTIMKDKIRKVVENMKGIVKIKVTKTLSK